MSDARPPEDEFEPEEEEQEELDRSPRASDKAAPAPRRGRLAPEPWSRPTGSAASDEELPYIDDRASKIWVAAIVAVFALILAYGLLFGKAGMLIPPTPSPSPSPTAAPTVTATPAPSGSITPAPSGSTTPQPSVTITPAPSTTAAPSATPTPAPSASPTPAPSST
jgi:hypothetical protein